MGTARRKALEFHKAPRYAHTVLPRHRRGQTRIRLLRQLCPLCFARRRSFRLGKENGLKTIALKSIKTGCSIFVTAGLSIKHLSVQIRISKESPRNPVNNENAPQKAGEEFGPLCLFNIQKKGTGKNPIPLLSVGYRKDVFMFFVDRVELSEFLMKSFALLTMKSKPTVLMKFSATQKMKLNPPIAAAISYAESVFHIAKQYFTHPQGWI